MYTTLIQVSATDHRRACRWVASITCSWRSRSVARTSRARSTSACSGCRRSRSRRRWPAAAGAGSRPGAVRVHVGVEDRFRPGPQGPPGAARRRRCRRSSTRTGLDVTWADDDRRDWCAATSTTRSATASSSSTPGRLRDDGAMRRIRYQEIADDLRAAGHGGTGRVVAAQRVGAVGPVRRQPGHRAPRPRAGPRRRPDRRPPGVRLVRRHRAGAPAPRAPRHDRGPARGRRAPRRATGDRVRRSSAHPTASGGSSASTRCCG